MNPLTVRYLAIVVGFSAITVEYWLAADPPSPWFLAITAAGILVSIGITLAKKRAGHFDNPDPTRARMESRIMVACLTTFAGILGVYAATAPNPVSSRLGFATFMSLVPAICTALLLRLTKSSASWGAVLFVYFALFVAEQLLWRWLHG